MSGKGERTPGTRLTTSQATVGLCLFPQWVPLSGDCSQAGDGPGTLSGEPQLQETVLYPEDIGASQPRGVLVPP